MSIKLADTLAPMGDFPAVEADNVDITISGTPKSLQQAYEDGDLGGGGSSIQVETMPAASAENVGKIVQYVGETDSYKNAYFYRCDYVEADDEYVWTEIVYGSNLQAGEGIEIEDDTISVKDRLEEVDELPTPTDELLDEKKCYLLRSEQTGFVRGSVYHVDGSEEQLINGTTVVRVGSGGLDDYEEYFDITGSHSDYNKKYTPKSNVVVLCKNFSPLTSYKEVAYFIAESQALRVHYADGSNDETFNYTAQKLYIKALVDLAWIPSGTNLDFDSDNFDVADDTVSLKDGYKKIFTGTHAEWDELTLEEKKSYDEADFTDDVASGFAVISDVVAEGDMNPVTSNAVAEAVEPVNEIPTKIQATMVNQSIGADVRLYPKSFKIQLYLGGEVDSNGKLCSFTLPEDMIFRVGGWGTSFTGLARNPGSGEITPVVVRMDIDANKVVTLIAESIPSGYTEIRVLNVTVFSVGLS